MLDLMIFLNLSQICWSHFIQMTAQCGFTNARQEIFGVNLGARLRRLFARLAEYSLRRAT
jgi:hypothetical protein